MVTYSGEDSGVGFSWASSEAVGAAKEATSVIFFVNISYFLSLPPHSVFYLEIFTTILK